MELELALAQPESGVGELVLRVVVCVTERLRVDVAEGFQRRGTAFAG